MIRLQGLGIGRSKQPQFTSLHSHRLSGGSPGNTQPLVSFLGNSHPEKRLSIFRRVSTWAGLGLMSLGIASPAALAAKTTTPIPLSQSYSSSSLNPSVVSPFSTPSLLTLSRPSTPPFSAKIMWQTRKTVSPGIVHRHMLVKTNKGLVRVNVLQVDPKNPRVNIRTVVVPRQPVRALNVRELVQASGGIAGVNASFFNVDKRIALGLTVRNGSPVVNALPDINRGSLLINNKGNVFINKAASRLIVTTKKGKVLKVKNMNQLPYYGYEIGLYTRYWGQYSPKSRPQDIQVKVVNGKVVARSKKRLLIPKNGYVIVGPARWVAKVLKPEGKIKSLKLRVTPNVGKVRYAVSGHSLLLTKGRIPDVREITANTPINGLGPRTIVGVTKNKKLLLVTVDGRQANSVGMTMYDAARFMRQIGAVSALNLDGGGSSQMVIGSRYVNSPSERYRSVATAIVLEKIKAKVRRHQIRQANQFI